MVETFELSERGPTKGISLQNRINKINVLKLRSNIQMYSYITITRKPKYIIICY